MPLLDGGGSARGIDTTALFNPVGSLEVDGFIDHLQASGGEREREYYSFSVWKLGEERGRHLAQTVCLRLQRSAREAKGH